MLRSKQVETMKTEFNERLSKLMARKKSDSVFLLTQEKYSNLIDQVKELKMKRYKDFHDYRTLSSYDTMIVNGKEKLVKPMDEISCNVKDAQFYVPTQELFGVLHTMHLLLNHPDKDKMDAEIKLKYCNVSKEVIKIYLSLCENCKSRRHKDMYE